MSLRAIFCINSGRSGSHYLHTLFRHVKGVSSHHEPTPNLQGVPMVEWNSGDDLPMRDGVGVRLLQIEGVNRDGLIWFESNNAFIKGFGRVICERIPHPEIGVIILHRDARKVATSITKNGWSVAEERAAPDKSNAWLLWPGMTMNVTNGPLVETEDSLALWYAKEIEARAKRFRKDHPRIKFFHAELASLNEPWYVDAMLAAFGLEPMGSIFTVIGTRTNFTEMEYQI